MCSADAARWSCAPAVPLRRGWCVSLPKPHAPQAWYATPIGDGSIGCNSIDEIRAVRAAGSRSATIRSTPFWCPNRALQDEKLKALKVADFKRRNNLTRTRLWVILSCSPLPRFAGMET